MTTERCLYYHAESDSYFWESPSEMVGQTLDEALCADVTDEPEHRREAKRRGVYDVVCPYCGAPAVLVDSKEVYGRSYGNIWLCRPCRAWVGVHKVEGNENKPLGRLADESLRDWKKRVHAAFDPLWKAKMRRDGCSKGVARKAAYTWLAEQLGISVHRCHIGEFDDEMCQRALGAIRGLTNRPRGRKIQSDRRNDTGEGG